MGESSYSAPRNPGLTAGVERSALAWRRRTSSPRQPNVPECCALDRADWCLMRGLAGPIRAREAVHSRSHRWCKVFHEDERSKRSGRARVFRTGRSTGPPPEPAHPRRAQCGGRANTAGDAPADVSTMKSALPATTVSARRAVATSVAATYRTRGATRCVGRVVRARDDADRKAKFRWHQLENATIRDCLSQNRRGRPCGAATGLKAISGHYCPDHVRHQAISPPVRSLATARTPHQCSSRRRCGWRGPSDCRAPIAYSNKHLVAYPS
jgi:hypothetical protein